MCVLSHRFEVSLWILTKSGSKPVAKLPSDRAALIKATINGTGKFFLGSDSAPHDISAKRGGSGKTSAGVFTQPYVTQLFLEALEQAIDHQIISELSVTPEVVRGFLGDYGRTYYGIKMISPETILLSKGSEKIKQSFTGSGVEVIPFRHGQEKTWNIKWK